VRVELVEDQRAVELARRPPDPLGQVGAADHLPVGFDVFRLFSPIPILLERERGYAFSAADLRREVDGPRAIGDPGVEPVEPDGKVIGGADLAEWVGVARELDCALILDEFYSHYIWRPDLLALGGIETAARYGRARPNRDPVVILDGLTKNWRYPGWRVTWTVGPKRVIEGVASAGSFLDGGGSRPLQRKAIDLLAARLTAAMAETKANPRGVRQEARGAAQRPARPGLHRRSAARGHVLRLGVGRPPAGVDQRRHGVLPRRARSQRDHRARRVLRRRAGQAPRRAGVAVPPPPAIFVRSAARSASRSRIERFKELVTTAS